MSVIVHCGDSRKVLAHIPSNSVDSVVSDAPYALGSIVRRFGGQGAAPARSEGASGVYRRASDGFMGETWDVGDTAFDPSFWVEVWRVVKPGGHLLVASHTTTYHRLACAIEDAGFEIRDMISWLYGTGFPKSHNHQRSGVKHGTALKPACEPWVLARKPLQGSVADNVRIWGTGALNIDGARVGDEVRKAAFTSFAPCAGNRLGEPGTATATATATARRGTQGEAQEYVGRWPANVAHDGSDEVIAAFPLAPGQLAPGQLAPTSIKPGQKTSGIYGKMSREGEASAARRYTDSGSTNFAALPVQRRHDEGSAARFFYSAKATKADRAGSRHPTVKPVALMQWLCRLATPPGGVVLDPFAGSGTTGAAALREGFGAILIEQQPKFVADIERRLNLERAALRGAA
ncbi:DNA-methyltransferase [Caulobacter sp.]|uniref:DNA-methyltransferase n=1 Tax=Caulobacter sp. TaxID=78 RepID=UPI003BB1F4ED